MKNCIIALAGLILVGWLATTLADPQPGKGQWQGSIGYSFQCYTCESGEFDCIAASPVWLQVVHDGSAHIQEFNPAAISTVTGLRYQGHLILTVLAKENGIDASMQATWRREDGFMLRVSERWTCALDGTVLTDTQSVNCR
ncbi:MAG TPA: hypothetical protein VNL17_06705 [Verrucomicrobiae bacterium]|nr:hypothetical protein [Verrucomicrobiae bacterium]